VWLLDMLNASLPDHVPITYDVVHVPDAIWEARAALEHTQLLNAREGFASRARSLSRLRARMPPHALIYPRHTQHDARRMGACPK
jgi:hypothetical protein